MGERLALLLNVANGCCWLLCFWWMHRISCRQDAVLSELQQQNRRIETLSKAEHDLIKEVHPKVGEIKDAVEQVTEALDCPPVQK